MFSTKNAMDVHFADIFLPSPYLYEQQPDSEEQIQTAAVLILLRDVSGDEADCEWAAGLIILYFV